MSFPHAYNIWKYMRDYLNYSFHKVSHIHIADPTEEDLRLKAQFIYIIDKLEQEDVRLIYLDEFAVAGGIYRNYGWGVKG